MTDKTNGDLVNGVDRDDPEYQRQIRRPADVKEDLRQMDTRKRVHEILTSQSFKDELEQIVNDTLVPGKGTESFAVLQELSRLVLPSHRTPAELGGISFSHSGVLPISDLRGVDALKYSNSEKAARCKLASTARLIETLGWTTGSNSVLSLKLGKNPEHFLIPPSGLLPSELTASSLIKVDMLGQVQDAGSTTLEHHKKVWSTYAEIHAARPDIKVLLPLQSPNALAVSSLKSGLLPISQHACVVGQYSTFEAASFSGLNDQEKKEIIRCLGPSNKVLMIRNCGFLIGGESVEEATWIGNQVLTACEAQIRVLPVGLDNLSLIPEEEREKIADSFKSSGKQEFEAYIRLLDQAGYRTDYPYQSISRKDGQGRLNDEIEYPPAALSSGLLDEPMSPMRRHQELQKKAKKTKWLGSPNVYEKKQDNPDQIITIGAASKGIIQRDHQHNATVYKQTVTPNPFTNMTEDDLQKYKQDLERKERGELPSPGAEGRLISTEERIKKVRQGEAPSTLQTTTVQSVSMNGEDATAAASPTKSVSSAATEGSREGSPAKEIGKSEKKKKKFRMPSFTKGKKK
ncbi:DgyrCDS13513 [Dimorphilus gyrociliatus]|uniref:DgyrCDS13513 n=1 Tax=Dimorphilus gyrociliatus TaxID=2664684 RepID=A0A7I8WAX0_9ANNE|nr:DgyrCDS13513 [Dimorphilus gyrociliatus]